MPEQQPLQQLHSRLEENIQRVEQLVEAVSDEALHTRPEPEKWSLAEIVEHLNAVAEPYVERLEPVIERARQAGVTSERSDFRYSWLWRTFIRATGPQGRKVRAPKKFRPVSEAAQLERDALMQRFRAVHKRFADALEAAHGLDLARVRHRNPVIPLLRMPIGASFEALVAHLERHLAQMQRLCHSNGVAETEAANA